MYCIKELSYLSLIKKTAINIMKGQGGGGIAKGSKTSICEITKFIIWSLYILIFHF